VIAGLAEVGLGENGHVNSSGHRGDRALESVDERGMVTDAASTRTRRMPCGSDLPGAVTGEPESPGQIRMSMAPFVVLATGTGTGSRNLGIGGRGVNV
jgi:hypothetical protein